MSSLKNGDLERFLGQLERLHEEGKTHVCVMPFSPDRPRLVGEYSWISINHDVCVASEHLQNESKLYVAARNYSLHKYTLAVRVHPQCSSVLLQKYPNSTPVPIYEESLSVAPHPPSRSPGDGACKGCGVSLGPTFDPTVVFVCHFSLSHEGKVVGQDESHMLLQVRVKG